MGTKKERGWSVKLQLHFFEKEKDMARLTFVLVDSSYCDYLRNTDPCVPYTMNSKGSRPFVGILLLIHGVEYYAPLSSPKPKHLTMKNSLDITKINGGQCGVINFNNMIPIHQNSVTPVNLKVLSTDTTSDIQYKGLLSKQLTWCNSNKQDIVNKAQNLYDLVSKGIARPNLLARCCDFIQDEILLRQYCLDNGWVL